MKIMVFDVPAEVGGALSILNEFYDEYKLDKDNNYIFVISKPELNETQNVKVLRYPWIKNSWFHRIFFDQAIAPYLVRKYKVDEVVSLQNITVPHTNLPQTLYIHNSLPFAEYRFSFFEDRLLWIYQNILSKSIFNSIKKANRIIVQTEWMKKTCINKLNLNSSNIEVSLPKVDIKVNKLFTNSVESLSTFFYPASASSFKNHRLIVEACLHLKAKGIENYKIIFTVKGNENKNILTLYKTIKESNLPIEFIGSLSRDKVFEYYTKSILIFPSYIETVGLPLVEAKMHETPILVSNCDFSKEVLKGYDKVKFYSPFKSQELADIMTGILDSNGIICYE